MATFQIDAGGASYEIDAPDEHAALSAFQSLGQHGPAAPGKPMSYFDPIQGEVSYTQGDVDRAKGSATDAFLKGGGQGLTFGAGDELYGALEAGRGQNYDQALAEARQG